MKQPVLPAIRRPLRQVCPPWKTVYAVAAEGPRAEARVTFECREGHRWTETVRGAPPNVAVYWGKANGGVHDWCPKCNPRERRAALARRRTRERNVGLLRGQNRPERGPVNKRQP